MVSIVLSRNYEKITDTDKLITLSPNKRPGPDESSGAQKPEFRRAAQKSAQSAGNLYGQSSRLNSGLTNNTSKEVKVVAGELKNLGVSYDDIIPAKGDLKTLTALKKQTIENLVDTALNLGIDINPFIDAEWGIKNPVSLKQDIEKETNKLVVEAHNLGIDTGPFRNEDGKIGDILILKDALEQVKSQASLPAESEGSSSIDQPSHSAIIFNAFYEGLTSTNQELTSIMSSGTHRATPDEDEKLILSRDNTTTVFSDIATHLVQKYDQILSTPDNPHKAEIVIDAIATKFNEIVDNMFNETAVNLKDISASEHGDILNQLKSEFVPNMEYLPIFNGR